MTLVSPDGKQKAVITHAGAVKEYSGGFLQMERVFPSYHHALQSYIGWQEQPEPPLKFCKHGVAGFCIRCSGGKG